MNPIPATEIVIAKSTKIILIKSSKQAFSLRHLSLTPPCLVSYDVLSRDKGGAHLWVILMVGTADTVALIVQKVSP